MTEFLDLARTLSATLFRIAGRESCKPLSIAVVDPGGHLVLLERQDGCGTLRPKIAVGKARTALALGVRSSTLEKMAVSRPEILSHLVDFSAGHLFPVAGGVRFRSANGDILGAVGVSGEVSDLDERLAVRGLEESGLIADE